MRSAAPLQKIKRAYLPVQFNLGPEQVGLAFLSGPLAYMLLSLVAGQLADKFVSHHIMCSNSFYLLVKLLIFSQGPRWFVVLGFFIIGIGFAFVGPADFIAQP